MFASDKKYTTRTKGVDWGQYCVETQKKHIQSLFIYTRVKVDGTVTMYIGLYKSG